MTEQKSVEDTRTPTVRLALSEIKDAVRELRTKAPESFLIDLAEQKIEMIEESQKGLHNPVPSWL
ncbi:hypothetical protein [Microvirga flavescens]|uniref:hypothetical protein n=1 Tax=Microvirga flavescens TaxID=2249811 RepID=UPI001300AD6D|nr:hypothetical protein [Microvirga flavescens]